MTGLLPTYVWGFSRWTHLDSWGSHSLLGCHVSLCQWCVATSGVGEESFPFATLPCFTDLWEGILTSTELQNQWNQQQENPFSKCKQHYMARQAGNRLTSLLWVFGGLDEKCMGSNLGWLSMALCMYSFRQWTKDSGHNTEWAQLALAPPITCCLYLFFRFLGHLLQARSTAQGCLRLQSP